MNRIDAADRRRVLRDSAAKLIRPALYLLLLRVGAELLFEPTRQMDLAELLLAEYELLKIRLAPPRVVGQPLVTGLGADNRSKLRLRERLDPGGEGRLTGPSPPRADVEHLVNAPVQRKNLVQTLIQPGGDEADRAGDVLPQRREGSVIGADDGRRSMHDKKAPLFAVEISDINAVAGRGAGGDEPGDVPTAPLNGFVQQRPSPRGVRASFEDPAQDRRDIDDDMLREAARPRAARRWTFGRSGMSSRSDRWPGNPGDSMDMRVLLSLPPALQSARAARPGRWPPTRGGYLCTIRWSAAEALHAGAAQLPLPLLPHAKGSQAASGPRFRRQVVASAS